VCKRTMNINQFYKSNNREKYPDGTVKEWSWKSENWENDEIKYCKIDKMTAYFNGSTQTFEESISFEKSFN
jgi:hypothetical protein